VYLTRKTLPWQDLIISGYYYVSCINFDCSLGDRRQVPYLRFTLAKVIDNVLSSVFDWNEVCGFVYHYTRFALF